MTPEEEALARRIEKWAKKRRLYKKIGDGGREYNRGYQVAMSELENFMLYIIKGKPDGE